MDLCSALTTPTGMVAGCACCAIAAATSPQTMNTAQIVVRIAASRTVLLATIAILRLKNDS
jgi:hypothetical protein